MRPFIDLFLDLLGTSTTKIHRLAVYNRTYLTHSNSSLVTKTGAVLQTFPFSQLLKHSYEFVVIYMQWMKLHLKTVWTICPSTINFVLPFSAFDLP